RRLVAAGISSVEVASFVDPRRVPQMAAAEEVVSQLERRPGVVYAGLALNERGYDRLAEAGLDEVRFAFGATESFNRRNQNASVEAGASTLDASVGGLGGCPFAPRATGNIATEDLVYLLEGEGVETGIDLDALVEVPTWLESVLGRTLEGQLYRAGVFPHGD